jgi:hypothetical protein
MQLIVWKLEMIIGPDLELWRRVTLLMKPDKLNLNLLICQCLRHVVYWEPVETAACLSAIQASRSMRNLSDNSPSSARVPQGSRWDRRQTISDINPSFPDWSRCLRRERKTKKQKPGQRVQERPRELLQGVNRVQRWLADCVSVGHFPIWTHLTK